MKMKDRFPEVFQVNGNPSFGVQNCVWTTFGEDEQSTADQDSAIEHAVLNHDRMVEEIAELKGALLEIKNTPDVQCDECPSIASAALAKLNQEGGE